MLTRQQISVGSLFDKLLTISARCSFISQEELNDLRDLIRARIDPSPMRLAMLDFIEAAEHQDDHIGTSQ